MSLIKNIIGFGSIEETDEYYKIPLDKPINCRKLYNEYYREKDEEIEK